MNSQIFPIGRAGDYVSRMYSCTSVDLYTGAKDGQVYNFVRVKSTKRKPAYKHDCTKCVYLDTIDFEGCVFDLYFCDKQSFGPTVIARFGDDGKDYNSGWNSNLILLQYAQCIATVEKFV
jgi:hypothetical protein